MLKVSFENVIVTENPCSSLLTSTVVKESDYTYDALKERLLFYFADF